jgi:hypothetical protein
MCDLSVPGAVVNDPASHVSGYFKPVPANRCVILEQGMS